MVIQILYKEDSELLNFFQLRFFKFSLHHTQNWASSRRCCTRFVKVCFHDCWPYLWQSSFFSAYKGHYLDVLYSTSMCLVVQMLWTLSFIYGLEGWVWATMEYCNMLLSLSFPELFSIGIQFWLWRLLTSQLKLIRLWATMQYCILLLAKFCSLHVWWWLSCFFKYWNLDLIQLLEILFIIKSCIHDAWGKKLNS